MSISYTYAVVALVIIAGVAMIGFSLIPNSQNSDVILENNTANYNQYVAAELSDKCAVPPGYTEEDWVEHMSHHPDRYEGCL